VTVAARLRIAEPRLYTDRPSMDGTGRLVNLPGSGGVMLGLHAGDSVGARVADHAMPGISLEDLPNSAAAHALICVGNRVRTLGGAPLGVVAGKRGGLAPGFLPGQFIGVEPREDVLHDAMLRPSEVVIETQGRGLVLSDFPAVHLMNCSPDTLDALELTLAAGAIEVAVRMTIPSVHAGAGLGTDPWIGDLEACGWADAEALRFGDLVAFADIDSRFTRFYRRGYVSVGVVSHGPSPVPGHGVGITLLLAGPKESLRVRAADQASLAEALIRWSAHPDLR
jgi:hypothetical protein